MRIVFLSIVGVILVGCGESKTAATNEPVAAVPEIETNTERGLPEMSDKQANAGDTVSVHYTGWLYDADAPDGKGQKFDSSVDRGQPFEFPLGAGRVIAGWDQGVAGMSVGEKKTLNIPPELGYGDQSVGGGLIPPNSTLIFDVELIEIVE